MTNRRDQTDAEALRQIAREVARLNNSRMMRVHNSAWRMISFHFVRGLAFGLGTLMGATLLASLLGWWLSQFEFVPILGEWLSQIVEQMQATD